MKGKGFSMTIRVGINGFGRIGRMALRAILEEKEFEGIEVVAVNGLQELSYMVYMLKYDSVHGRLKAEIKEENGCMIINGRSIRVTNVMDPANICWGESRVDVVIESTGVFLTEQTCQSHLVGGAKKVVISAPSKDDTIMFVYGVNHQDYAYESIVSAASCTTNGLAPVVKVLHDAFGVKRGLMTTVHSVTASQLTVDGESRKDWRGGRGAMENIIPSATGAANAVGKIIPALDKKISGMAFRVPTSNVSVVDFTCELTKATDYKTVCQKMKEASINQLQGVMAYNDEQLVSTDFRGVSAASIFDAGAGMMLDENFVKVIAWYDNEYGYTCNLIRLVQHIAQ
jgi:glyceraldehyde 3-phosphate dehydrogenase